MTEQDSRRFLEWDTEFFGRRIGQIDAPAVSAEAWSRTRDWARSNRLDCLYLLAPAEDPSVGLSAQNAGFRLVDVRLTLEWESAGPPLAAESALRHPTEADLPALRAIARVSHTDSRFYADPHFSRDRCDALYETWIEKSCRGWADEVWVAEREERPIGYVTIHREAEAGAARIGLIAVAPDARGQGIGEHLIRRSQAGFQRLTTVTQGRNIGAQRLYQRCGFVSSAVGLWFHLWFEGAP